MTARRLSVRLACTLVAFALPLSACGDAGTPTSPSPTTPTATAVEPTIAEDFTDTLAVNGGVFYSFEVTAYGTVNLTLQNVGATRLFTGTLAPRGSAFYPFTVPQDSGVFLTLASVAPSSGRGAVATPLALGLGVPRGTGCAVTTQVVVAADLAAQLREWRTAGVHCASLADAGALTADVAFAVRIGYFQ